MPQPYLMVRKRTKKTMLDLARANQNMNYRNGTKIGCQLQGAKKIIFTACHSGKLKLPFTSPDVISTSPKSFLISRIDFTVVLLFEFLIKLHLPVGQVKNRIH